MHEHRIDKPQKKKLILFILFVFLKKIQNKENLLS